MCDQERRIGRFLRPHFLIGVLMGIGLTSVILESALVLREDPAETLGIPREKRDASPNEAKSSIEQAITASEYEVHNLGLKLRSAETASIPSDQNGRVVNFNTPNLDKPPAIDYFDVMSESEFLTNDRAMREVSGRSLVYIGVMTDQRTLSEQAAVVRMTWASQVPIVQFFYADVTRHRRARREHVPEVIGLPDIDKAYGTEHTYQTLKHICENFVNDYHWFVLVRDATYVYSSGLIRLLDRLVPSEDVAIGLAMDSHTCLVEAGMIFSSHLLSRLCPVIAQCRQHAHPADASRDFARCLHYVGGIQCVSSAEISPTLHVYSGESTISAAKAVQLIEDDTIFITRMESPDDFYTLHLHFTRMKIRKTQDEIYRLGKELARTHRSILPQRETKTLNLEESAIFGSGSLVNKSTEPFYQFIDRDGGIFLDTCKVRKQDAGRDAMSAYQTALLLAQESVRKVNPFPGSGNFESFAYKVDKPNLGVEYHFYFIEEITEDAPGKKAPRTKERVYQVTVQQPYGRPEMEEKEVQDVKPVNFVVPTSGSGQSLDRFLQNYQRVCLTPVNMKGRCSVLFVLFKKSKLVLDEGSSVLRDTLADLKTRHPHFEYQVLQVQGESFTVARTIQMADSAFSRDDLLAFMPTEVLFSKEFLFRCQMNTYMYKRAYFPVVFQRYAQSAAAGLGVSSLPDADVLESALSSEDGFWANSDFTTLCTYNEDLQTFQHLPSSSRDLYNMFEDSETMTVFRAPDPGLVRVWRKDLCASESSLLRNDCVKEQKYMNMQ